MANIAPGDEQNPKEQVQKILDKLKVEYPGLWESLNDNQRQRVLNAAIANGKSGYWAFRRTLWTFPLFTNWSAANPGVGTPPGGEGGGTSELPPVDPESFPGDINEPPPGPSISDPTVGNQDIRDILVQFLRDNDLPDSLIAFINDALAQGMGATEVVARLRQTPEYLAAYPENALRRDNGFSWMQESQIRAMRDEINRLTEGYFNVRLTPAEVAGIIANDKSLSEWEGQLRDYADFQRWGPTVQAVLEWELGYRISDERAFALLSSEISTPELMVAYERALMRGQPAILGLGIRPEDEAELLRRYGINPEQAFKGYQGIVGELPSIERFAAIENNINANASSFPTGSDLFNDTPFALLFRAIQLGDTTAIRTLQATMQREVTRFAAQGGAVRSGTELVGLLPGGRQPG